MTMYFILLCSVFVSFLCITEQAELPCRCKSKANCHRIDDWNQDKKEVIIVTNNNTDYMKWKWDSFTTVIEWNDEILEQGNIDLMCYAHSQGKKYGLYEKDFPDTLNASDPVLNSYILTRKSQIDAEHADFLALNLITYLHNCSYAGQHVNGIINVTRSVISGIKKDSKVKILCVMPWKPPCYDADCNIGPSLASLCDGVIFSPESYNTYCDESCTAKATVSYSKVTIGITEYLAAGFNESQLLVAVPWHGYNYTCEKGDQIDGLSRHFVCHLKQKTDPATGNKVCDLAGSRVQKSIGSSVGQVPEMALLDSNFSKADQSPFKVDYVMVGNVNQSYLTWFENIGSLMAKYKIVQDYNIKGCVVFTADDLTYNHMITNEQFDNHMWAWMLHSILVNADEPITETKMNIAGTMAGVGMGMFLLGCLFGTIISCVVFRRQKRLRPPFSRDPLALTDEYRDDDNQL